MKQLTQLTTMGCVSLLLFAVAAFSSPNASNSLPIQQAILHDINQYRTTHHLSKLTLVPAISQEATQHSMNMARHRTAFGHTHFNLRMNRLYKTIKGANGGAENVAYNYKNAKTVVKQWLLSPGHRHNIEGNYQLTGIGVARDEKGRIYYTQIFIRTRLTV